ncbi:MAG: hypothetical protein HYT87_13905 [Nitrospirae bacterium]|nr:hypothetical protein [Nitrospirota bacterium]
MSKTWILPIAGLLALVIAVVALVARFTSQSLEPPASVSSLPEDTSPPPANPPPATLTPPQPVAPPAPPPTRTEIRLEDLENFKTLSASPFPSKSEWPDFVARAEAVAKEHLEKTGDLSRPIDLAPLKEAEKQGLPAAAAMRAAFQARKIKAQQDYDEFTKKVDEVYQSWGDKKPEVPQETMAALVTDLVNHRARLLFIDDRLSRLQ